MSDRHAKLKAKHAALKAKRAPAPASLTRSLPCVREGDVIEACRTCAGEAGHVRECDTHGRCTRTERNKGVAVCATCSDYQPDSALLPKRPGWLTVPQPPVLDLRPTVTRGLFTAGDPSFEGMERIGFRPDRSRAVVTVVVGDEAKRCFAVSGPLMQAYAERVGADLVVLKWPGHPSWPMSSKFAIARVLDHYERIAYVDADALLRPGCVDLFAMCAPDEFGICDELPWHRAAPKFGREVAYQQFRSQMGFKPTPHLPWYANAGVMVVPRSHRELLLPPAGPMPTGHCAEQDHTNARLLDSGLPYRLMDRRANWQNWCSAPNFADAPPDAVLHWSGAGAARVSRAEQMRQWAAAAK